MVGKERAARQFIEVEVRWCKPSPGWFKLNTDGSVNVERNSGGGGGIIREVDGRWVAGFGRRLPEVMVIAAEFHAV